MTEKQKQVILIPVGGKITMDRNAACMSVLINDMLAEDDDEETPEIPVPSVTKEIMEFVVEFCNKHVNDPLPDIERPLKSSNMGEIVSEWDAKKWSSMVIVFPLGNTKTVAAGVSLSA